MLNNIVIIIGVQKSFVKFLFYYCFVFKLHLEPGVIIGLLFTIIQIFEQISFLSRKQQSF